MKKTISVILCLIMMLSCFACLSLTASAADATQYLKASAAKCINDQITVNVKVAKGKSIKGAVVFFEYDPAVVAPVTGGIASAASGAEETHGAKINSSNGYSVGFAGNKLVGSTTADTDVLYATFKVVSANRPKTTTIKVSCDQILLDGNQLVRNNDNTAMSVATLSAATMPVVNTISAANQNNGTVKVSWGAVAGISKYTIYRGELNADGSFKNGTTKVGSVTDATVFIDNSKLVEGAKYKYIVLCVVGTTASDIGNTATVVYKNVVPAGVSVSLGVGKMNISWKAISGATGYRVYKRPVNADNTVGAWVKDAEVTGTSYADSTKFTKNGTYDFSVTSINGGVESARSASVRAKYVCNIPKVTTASAAYQSNGTVKVKWSAVSGATSYTIYRGELNADNSPKGGTSKVGSVTGKTEFIDSTKLVSGTKYQYIVLAVVGSNASDNGNQAIVVYGKTITSLSAPTGVAASLGVGKVNVSWKAVANATGFRVYRRTVYSNGNVSSWAQIADVTGTSYSDSSKLTKGTSYDYCVKSVNGSVVSSYSATSRVKYVCKIPTVTTANAVNQNGAVKVTWGAVSGAERYTIYRGELNPNGTVKSANVKIASVSATEYIDKDTALVDGATYQYTILAVVGSNASDTGKTAKVVYSKSGSVVSAPTGVSASLGVGKMNISWKAVSGATGYRVYRRDVSANGSVGSWAKIADVTGTSYADSSKFTRNASYDYSVKSLKNTAESAYSASARAKYVCNIPTVTTANAVNQAGSIKVSWGAVSGAERYTIYRGELNSDGSIKSANVKIASVYSTEYVDSDAKLVSGAKYQYIILAVVGSNASDNGEIATVVYNKSSSGIAAPTGVSAVLGVGKMNISWSAVSGATGYRVYRRDVNAGGTTGAWVKIADVTGTSYADSSKFTRNASYDYSVTAVNGSTESSYSASARAKYVCNIPTVTTANAVNQAGSIKVSWGAVSGAERYTIYRGELNSDGSIKSANVKIASVYSTEYVDSDAKLVSGAKYQYIVLTVVGSNASDNGEIAVVVKQ